MNQIYNCYITHIEIVGKLIKVWVQHNAKFGQDIKDALLALNETLEYAEVPSSIDQLSRNGSYCIKNSNDEYYRCGIIGKLNSSPSKVNVAFIDYGSTQIVNLSDIKIISNELKQQYSVLTCPGQAIFYYLYAVAIKPGSLTERELEWLKARTISMELPCCVYDGLYGIRMISIFLDHSLELSSLLVQKGHGSVVSRDEQCNMAKELMSFPSAIPYTSINTSSAMQNVTPKYQTPQVNTKIEVIPSQSNVARKPSMPIYQPPPVYQQHVTQQQMTTMQQPRYIVPKEKLVSVMPFPSQSTVKKTFDNTITVGSAYQMYVSHVEDGPLQFSLQLKQYADEVLPCLSVQMNKLTLQKFTSALAIGMTVIGMHSPDKTLRRGMIINAGSNTCRVYYVDLGSTETLQHSNIFQLPPGLNTTQIPAVAINFALKGTDPTQISDAVKSGFRDLVMSKVVLAKVMTEGPVRTCDLFVDGRDVRTLMANFNHPLQYLRQFPPRDRDNTVVVSCVEGPQQIFVQYKSETSTLTAIEETLNSVWSLQKEITNVNGLSIGKPVLSLYSTDNHWYRAQIMEISPNQIITVLYVDYGNKEYVNVTTLRDISPDLVSKWRCQAVECCLVGFDCILPSDVLSDKLEEKILSSEVSLRVHSLLSADRLLVDLIDFSGNSIAAYLTEIHNNCVAEAQKNAALTETTSSNIRDVPIQTQTTIDVKSESYSYDEPKPPRKKEDLNQKNKSKDQDFPAKVKPKDPYEDSSSGNKWKSKDSYEDTSSANKWKSKDSYEDSSSGNKWKSKDSYEDTSSANKWKSKDSYEDTSSGSKWKSKDSYEDTSSGNKWKSKDSYEDTSSGNKWKSKDSYEDSSSGNKWKSKGSHEDVSTANKWKPKDTYEDSNKWKSKDSYEDSSSKWKSRDERLMRGGDATAIKKPDNKFSRGGGGKEEKWSKDDKWQKDDKWKKEDKWQKDDKWKSGKNDRDDNRGSKWNKEERFTIGEKKSDWKSKDSGNRKWEDDGRKGRGEFKWKDTKFQDDYDSKKTKTLYSDATPEKDKSWDGAASVSDVNFNPKVKEFVGWNLEGKSCYTVTLTHIDSPERFYVRPVEADTEIERLRDLIDSDSNATSRVLPPKAIIVGTPVLAVYSEDGALYRAIIEKVNSKTVNVLFVDFGNSAEVAMHDLYYPTDTLARFPMTVIACSLTNIKPTGGSWTTDSDTLIELFGGESQLSMTIDSVKLIDGLPLHNVTLMIINTEKSVAQVLVDAGIAKSTSAKGSTPALQSQESVEPSSALPLQLTEESTNEEIWVERLELLVGQFLLSQIVSVVSAETVIVKLDATNLIVICTSPDLDTSSVQIGDKVIIQVNCVLEDRLRVTVYDKGGYVAGDTKKELPQVSAVCPMPITRSHFRITIPHCDGSSIYAQKTSDADRIAETLDSLYAFYEGTKSSNKEFPVNMLCTVKSNDENWYRARVVKREGDSYTIRFIDYGNTEDVQGSQIRKLDNQFFFPELAFKAEVNLKWKVPVSDINLMKFVEEKEFNANFLKRNSQDWIVSLVDDEKNNLSDELIKQGLGENYKENPFCESNSVIGNDIVAGDKIHVTVTHVESPKLFWVQMIKHMQTVESIQEKLQSFNEGKKDTNCAIFAAKYSADNMWYRALGIDPDNPNLVRFVDYGNTDEIVERKELSHTLTKPRSGYAVKMCLCVEPVSGEWSQEALDMFEQFIDVGPAVAEIISVSYKIVTDLLVNEESISKKLIDSGLAVYEDFTPSLIKEYLSIKESQVTSVFVCHTLSVNDFHVLDKAREPELEELTAKLEDENYPAIESPKVGDIVAAKFPEDDSWYRAKLIELNPLTVLFIDFGNTSVVDEIGRLPAEVKNIPAFAIHCSLGLDYESDLALDKFIELSDEGKSVFNMSLIKIGDPSIVKMTLNESDIIDLLPKVQSSSVNLDGLIGFVSHFNTFDDFYIQLMEDTKLDNVIDELAEAENFSDVEKTLSTGSLVAAQFPEDESWYRAKVTGLEPLTVLFYDFGNTSEVTNIKELPPDLKLIPALSYKCILEKPDSVDNWTESMIDSFLDLSQDGQTPFTIKVVKEGTPQIVRLLDENNKNIIESISSDNSSPKPTSVTADGDLLSSNMKKIDLNSSTIDNKLITFSHVESIDDFYVNLVDDSTRLKVISEKLSKPTQLDDNFDIIVGDIVVAPLPDSDEWERAKILSSEPLSVFFIDTGIIANVIKTKKLPTDLDVSSLKPLAYHCALKTPSNNDNRSDMYVLEDYMTLSLDKLKIKVHSDGNPSIVSLFLKDKNIISKLNSVSSISGAFISSEFNNQLVYISYGEAVDDFYVQKAEDSDKLDELVDSLSHSFSFKSLNSDKLSIGSLVSAQSPDDDLWYRACVISVKPKITVQFVDYGNSTVVEKVRELPEYLKKLPPLALKCSLKLPKKKSHGADIDKFNDLLEDSEAVYNLTVEVNGNPAIVSLFKDGKNVLELFGFKNLKQSNSNTHKKKDTKSSDMNDKLAILSHVNNLDEFYVQLLDDADAISELIQKLCYGDNFAEISDVKEGSMVAAQFIDLQWHRAVILKKLEEGYDVFFTDYGNKSTVTNVRELPDELKTLPSLSYKLRLKKPEGIPEWTEQMEKQFALFKDINTLPLVILTQPTDCVSLMLNDVNIFNKFTSLSLDRNDASLVFVTYSESPSNFYVQYNTSLDSQTKITEGLKDAADLKDTENLKEGDLVCGKYPDDGLYYRSKILKTLPEISAMLVDFGNTYVVVETKELPDELKSIEPLAKHCCLVPPRCGSGWSIEASSYFLAMSSSPFTIKIIEDGSPATVDLFIDGNSVTSDLLELCPIIERLPDKSLNEDLDIDEEDIIREEAIFNGEQSHQDSIIVNSDDKIVCNGISDLTIDEETEKEEDSKPQDEIEIAVENVQSEMKDESSESVSEQDIDKSLDEVIENIDVTEQTSNDETEQVGQEETEVETVDDKSQDVNTNVIIQVTNELNEIEKLTTTENDEIQVVSNSEINPEIEDVNTDKTDKSEKESECGADSTVKDITEESNAGKNSKTEPECSTTVETTATSTEEKATSAPPTSNTSGKEEPKLRTDSKIPFDEKPIPGAITHSEIIPEPIQSEKAPE